MPVNNAKVTRTLKRFSSSRTSTNQTILILSMLMVGASVFVQGVIGFVAYNNYYYYASCPTTQRTRTTTTLERTLPTTTAVIGAKTTKPSRRKRPTTTTTLSLAISSIPYLTVAQVNTLLVPVFIASAFPYAALVYNLYQLPSFPSGAKVGFAWVLLLGFIAGPADVWTQHRYDGTSFFDCDWIHGTVSSLFATGYTVANIALLQSMRSFRPEQEREQQEYRRYLTYCTVVTLGILVISWIEYSWYNYQVHSPHWFGVLDRLATNKNIMSPALLQFVQEDEPANALSVATWFNHVLEITQFQMLMRFISAQQRPAFQRLAWSLVPLQVSNICIIEFHLLYNQVAPLYLAFGILLLVGNLLAAVTASQLVRAEQEEKSSDDDDDDDEVADLAMTRVAATNTRVSSATSTTATITTTTTTTNTVMDTPAVYLAKSLVIGLIVAYLVKYGSLLVHLPAHINAETAWAVALPLVFLCVWDIQTRVPPPPPFISGEKLKSAKRT